MHDCARGRASIAPAAELPELPFSLTFKLIYIYIYIYI